MHIIVLEKAQKKYTQELLCAAIKLPTLSSSLLKDFSSCLYAHIGSRFCKYGSIARALDGLMWLAAAKPYYMTK